MDDTQIYFAYGSNLHRHQMRVRCPTSVPLRRCMLPGWRLLFRECADIVRHTGSVVHGALYSVRDADIAELDAYEGVEHGLYGRAETQAGGLAVFFYVMDPAFFVQPPEENYFAVIRQGFLDWQLPMESLESARRHAIKHTGWRPAG